MFAASNISAGVVQTFFTKLQRNINELMVEPTGGNELLVIE